MKLILLFVLLFADIGDVNYIATVNKYKKEAEKAYLNQNYEQAIKHYKYLVDSLNVQEPKVLLNLSNAYYRVKDTASAASYYERVMDSEDKVVKTTAHQQLGLLAHQKQQYQQALAHFKEALKTDPGNEEARYNYELVKKTIKDQQQQQNQDQQQQNQDQQNQDQQEQNQDQQQQDQQQQQQQEQDQQDSEQESEQQEQEQGEQKESEQEQSDPEEGEQDNQQQMGSPQDMEELKISKEKARMILEAMRNNEKQYIQQNKRRARKNTNDDKPDW